MARMSWWCMAALGIVGIGLAVSAKAQQTPKPERLWVYVGTYTWGKSKGVYLAHLDTATGRLDSVHLAGESTSPSFVAIHPTRPFLYAVNEVGEFAGRKTGSVSAFSIDKKTGSLKLLNQQSSEGPGPCHVTVDRSGRCVLVANYSGGSVACLPIREDGSLEKAASFHQHQGSSTNPQRQEGPHAHSANVDAANRFAFVADLGLDKIFVYRLQSDAAKLAPNDPAFASVSPGSGPRHFAFHPSGRYAYVINELASTVTAFEYSADRGELQSMQTISTLPEGFQGNSTTAEVQVHPSGKFLYGSNRGHDSIAIFTIDLQTGKLRHVGNESTGGKTPRNFGIDPSGKFLLAANQDSGNLVVSRIDQETGKLQPTGSEAKIDAPVCVKIIAPMAD